MGRDPKYDILFEPIRIGPKTMKNRFYQAPHCTGFGSYLPGSQAQFRATKAEGGWAVVNTEATQIHPDDDLTGFDAPAQIWDDHDVRNWSLMVERVHEHGALAGIELQAGLNSGYDSRRPARGVTNIVSDALWMGAVYAMDKKAIRELHQHYLDAAERARSAGFDIVNVSSYSACATPSVFLMSIYNTRTDEYGGPLENRARFLLETLELVRGAVGDDCAVTTRFGVDSLHGSGGGGIRVEEEGVGVIELADHLVDFWDLQVGGPNMAAFAHDIGPSRFYGENFQGEIVAKVRPHTEKPIVGVGRFTNPDTMVAAIRSGQLDIIGATRPSIADPFLPKKIEEGRLDEIRECIGCNVCVSRFYALSRVVCTQNATTGEEYRRGWHPENFEQASNCDNDVLVVGAGPAGLECAIVLAKRGMRRIHLVDADGDIGGHLQWVTQLPRMGEWGRVIDHRRIQLSKLRSVEVLTDLELDAQAVRDYGAAIVIIATGSHWATDGLNGHTQAPLAGADASLPFILVPEQVGLKEIGDRVLVYDTEGYFMGTALAEKFAGEGRTVRLLSPFPGVAPYQDLTGENQLMLPHLFDMDVELLPAHQLTSIQEGRAFGHQRIAPEHEMTWEFDSIVLVTQRVADDGLYQELDNDRDLLASAGISALYRVGDCVAPRMQVADAIFDGHRLAREIDSEDPSVPRPYIRERRVIGLADGDYEALILPHG